MSFNPLELIAGRDPLMQNNVLVAAGAATAAAILYWQSIQSASAANAVEEAIVDGMEAAANAASEEANPLNRLERTCCAKFVKGVKFPVSRHNPPRVSDRTEGI